MTHRDALGYFGCAMPSCDRHPMHGDVIVRTSPAGELYRGLCSDHFYARRTHACPLCRMDGVPHRMATCVVCWRLVPPDLKRRLIRAFVGRREDPDAHRDALRDLLVWCSRRNFA